MATSAQGIGQYDNNNNSYQPTYEKDDAYSNSYSNSYNYYQINQHTIAVMTRVLALLIHMMIEITNTKIRLRSYECWTGPF